MGLVHRCVSDRGGLLSSSGPSGVESAVKWDIGCEKGVLIKDLA